MEAGSAGAELVQDVDYALAADGMTVTLSPDYLAKLAVGKHALVAMFTDGTASASFTVAPADPGPTPNPPDPPNPPGPTPTPDPPTPTPANRRVAADRLLGVGKRLRRHHGMQVEAPPPLKAGPSPAPSGRGSSSLGANRLPRREMDTCPWIELCFVPYRAVSCQSAFFALAPR